MDHLHVTTQYETCVNGQGELDAQLALIDMENCLQAYGPTACLSNASTASADAFCMDESFATDFWQLDAHAFGMISDADLEHMHGDLGFADLSEPNHDINCESNHSDPELRDGQNSPPSTDNHKAARRRAQNRAAQRAYRARRNQVVEECEARVATLEKEISELKSSNNRLRNANSKLCSRMTEMQRNLQSWPRRGTNAKGKKALMGGKQDKEENVFLYSEMQLDLS